MSAFKHSPPRKSRCRFDEDENRFWTLAARVVFAAVGFYVAYDFACKGGQATKEIIKDVSISTAVAALKLGGSAGNTSLNELCCTLAEKQDVNIELLRGVGEDVKYVRSDVEGMRMTMGEHNSLMDKRAEELDASVKDLRKLVENLETKCVSRLDTLQTEIQSDLHAHVSERTIELNKELFIKLADINETIAALKMSEKDKKKMVARLHVLEEFKRNADAEVEKKKTQEIFRFLSVVLFMTVAAGLPGDIDTCWRILGQIVVGISLYFVQDGSWTFGAFVLMVNVIVVLAANVFSRSRSSSTAPSPSPPPVQVHLITGGVNKQMKEMISKSDDASESDSASESSITSGKDYSGLVNMPASAPGGPTRRLADDA